MDEGVETMKGANEWTPEEMEIYEVGHREGESCRQVDWEHALTEMKHELPEEMWADGDLSPSQVANYIDGLLDEIDKLRIELAARAEALSQVMNDALAGHEERILTALAKAFEKNGDKVYDGRAVARVVRSGIEPKDGVERQVWKQKSFVEHYGMPVVYPDTVPMYGVANPGTENQQMLIATELDEDGNPMWRLRPTEEMPWKATVVCAGCGNSYPFGVHACVFGTGGGGGGH